MSSWRFLPDWLQKITWSTPRFLVALEVVADLVGRADRAAEPEEALLLHDLRAEAVTRRRDAASTASGA